MANEISIDITEDITQVSVTEDVTTLNITPTVTTVEVRGISIADSNNASAQAYNGNSNTLAKGATVAEALDHVNTNGFNKNADNTIVGDTTIEFNSTLSFTSSTAMAAYNALNLNNNDIIGINNLSFADAGANEGIKWDNVYIFESDDALTGDVAGDLQVTYKQSDDSYARRFTVRDTGVDLVGNITASGDITSNASVEKLSKLGSVTLVKGDVVYLSGYANGKALVDKALASDTNKMPAYGIVSAVSGDNVDVATLGKVNLLPLPDYSTGQKLYVSSTTAGGTVTSPPTGEANSIQNIANIENTNPSINAVISEPNQVTDTQHVYISSASKSGDGNTLTVTISYKCDDSTTTGIGFTLGFDSNIFNTEPTISNVYSTGLISGGSDTGNSLNFSWADLGNAWPGSNSIDLATIAFTLSENTTGSDTTLTFTESSSASGFSFAGQDQLITGVLKGATESIGTVKINGLNSIEDTPNLNTGNFFLGVADVATPTDFNTSVQNYLATGTATFGGTATTQSYPNNTTKVATTEYVTTAIADNPGPTGPQGETGPTGAASTVAGPTGSQGETGPTGAASTVAGPTGPDGETGPTGAASTVACLLYTSPSPRD